MRMMVLILAMLMSGAPSMQILTVDLRPETIEGFHRYREAAEARISKEESDAAAFLYLDSLPAWERRQAKDSLTHAQIFIRQLKALDASGHAIHAPGGLIHHWVGVVFIPSASLEQTLALAEDYDHQQDYCWPQVVRSQLLSRDGNEFKVYLRLQEQKIITVILDTDHAVRYAQLDPVHVSSRSYSTRIQEVRNAGEPDEYRMPVGHDGGFLWRADSYWRFEEADGGVYVECESIALTRSIPTAFDWMIEPFVTSVPRQTLQATLDDIRNAVLKRRKP
jgi:hypothetical protein